MPNFSLARLGFGITATTSATAVLLPDNPQGATDMMVYNPGPSVVRLAVGGANVSATATGNSRAMPILPGEKGAWQIGTATHYSAQVASGTQEIECYFGAGE